MLGPLNRTDIHNLWDKISQGRIPSILSVAACVNEASLLHMHEVGLCSVCGFVAAARLVCSSLLPMNRALRGGAENNISCTCWPRCWRGVLLPPCRHPRPSRPEGRSRLRIVTVGHTCSCKVHRCSSVHRWRWNGRRGSFRLLLPPIFKRLHFLYFIVAGVKNFLSILCGATTECWS